MPHRLTLGLGLASALAAIVLAAAGAHGPLAPTAPETIRQLDTAVTFHLFHSLALMMLAFWPGPRRLRLVIAGIWLAGVALFSGSLYAQTLMHATWPGILTPLGGLLLMLGWLAWLVALPWSRTPD
ncbi:DUF423 domain-containing protein [Guyparkeria sp. 1SP6A2]|nr:DUF423 domain-containing protein [Guyparkeria sp. 1SP6A2]